MRCLEDANGQLAGVEGRRDHDAEASLRNPQTLRGQQVLRAVRRFFVSLGESFKHEGVSP